MFIVYISPVIEVELEIPQHLGDDGPVLRGHVHPHQHHHGPGHSSLVIEENIFSETYMKYIPMIWEKNNTRTLELFDEEIQMKNLDIVSNKPLQCWDYLSKAYWGNLKSPCRTDHDDSDHNEGELLWPHGHVDVHPEPVDQDVERLGDGVDLADPVKHDIDGGDENLPGAVDREEVAEEVKVFALTGLTPLHPLERVLKLMRLEKQEPGGVTANKSTGLFELTNQRPGELL